MSRILDAVAQAAVETTEAERSVVFQLTDGRLTPMASAGSPPPSWEALQAAATQAIDKGMPVTVAGTDARVVVAAPLVLPRGPVGALVIETPARVEPTDDDLELLALFSSQAAVAIRNTHELERLRSGALAALGRMATQVAHELKNPLAGLRLYARHLEQRLDRQGDAESADLSRKVTSTIDHLAAVVSEITAFGRPPELHPTPTVLAVLLDECLTLARARCPSEDIEIERAYDATCPEATVDGRELRKAFLNLMLNALEAMEDRGTLTIGTQYSNDTRMVTVAIDDSGPGMTEETLSRMFDLFFTTKAEGTGLGMAIARSVIDLHGGALAIHSTPGRGTQVRVRLPIDGPGRAGKDAR
jgi:two-component system sensor histidine kinase HydH